MMVFAYVSAAIFALLGGLHLIYTLLDFWKGPRYFAPRDKTLLEQMRATQTAIAPKGRDYWSGILGFHLSHSIGVLLFSLLIVIAAGDPILWLRVLLAATGALYVLIAWRCWFHIPMWGSLIGTGLMVAAWISP